jgi:hypothetical protein
MAGRARGARGTTLGSEQKQEEAKLMGWGFLGDTVKTRSERKEQETEIPVTAPTPVQAATRENAPAELRPLSGPLRGQ